MTWYKARTDPEIILYPGGTRMKPLATFSDDQGNTSNLDRMHIICDDHQLVLVHERGGISRMTPWWPPEITWEAAKNCVKRDNNVSPVRIDLENKEPSCLEAHGNLKNALQAADILNCRHCENMMGTGRGFDFDVTYNMSTHNVTLSLGPYPLWDDEDENDGKFEVDDIVAYAQDEINSLARTFTAALEEEERKKD